VEENELDRTKRRWCGQRVARAYEIEKEMGERGRTQGEGLVWEERVKAGGGRRRRRSRSRKRKGTRGLGGRVVRVGGIKRGRDECPERRRR